MPGHPTHVLVAYCGLYCGLCAQRIRVPEQARQLRETLHDEEFDDFYQYIPDMKDSFPVFWKFLQSLAHFPCGCRDGSGGPPDCKIRECARQRGVRVCPECKAYPCDHVQALGTRYPTLVEDGRRMQKVGLEKWIAEQEGRAERGFCYADIRYSRIQ